MGRGKDGCRCYWEEINLNSNLPVSRASTAGMRSPTKQLFPELPLHVKFMEWSCLICAFNLLVFNPGCSATLCPSFFSVIKNTVKVNLAYLLFVMYYILLRCEST